MMGAGAWALAGEYCAVSAALTALVCCYAQVLGYSLLLIDEPDALRKVHHQATPLIGGLAILLPSLIASCVYYAQRTQFFAVVPLLAATLAMMLLGAADDRHDLSPRLRILAFVGLTLGALLLDPLLVLHTLRLGQTPGSLEIPLGIAAIPVSALMVIGFINAANMADGMNGQLMGSMLIWCLFIARHFGVELGLPFLAVAASSAAALTFNLRSKLFSGSAGSYGGSLMVGLGAIACYHHGAGAMSAALPVLWFWLPVLDCLRLLIARPLAGRSPFAADRNHLHHMLMQRFGARGALILYLAFLAAPGAAAEISLQAGAITLAVCILCYVVFVVTLPPRINPG